MSTRAFLGACLALFHTGFNSLRTEFVAFRFHIILSCLLDLNIPPYRCSSFRNLYCRKQFLSLKTERKIRQVADRKILTRAITSWKGKFSLYVVISSHGPLPGSEFKLPILLHNSFFVYLEWSPNYRPFAKLPNRIIFKPILVRERKVNLAYLNVFSLQRRRSFCCASNLPEPFYDDNFVHSVHFVLLSSN